MDLVRFDHTFEDVLDGDAFALACQVVRDGEDGTEIVGRVAPCDNKEVIFISVGVEGRGGRWVIYAYILQRGSSR